jgi:hypothetical protein
MSCAKLSSTCLGVFWVIRELPIVLDMKRLAKTRPKFKLSRDFVIQNTNHVDIPLQLSLCDRLTATVAAGLTPAS